MEPTSYIYNIEVKIQLDRRVPTVSCLHIATDKTFRMHDTMYYTRICISLYDYMHVHVYLYIIIYMYISLYTCILDTCIIYLRILRGLGYYTIISHQTSSEFFSFI